MFNGLLEDQIMIKIAPSILSADFTKLGADVDECIKGGADYIHFDVMDGLFVPNISIGIPVLKSLRKYTDAFIDVHLMIDRPVRYVEDFINAGADLLTFHVEADTEENIKEAIKRTKAANIKAGLSLKPGTDADIVIPFMDDLDLVLVMTVEPGFGGQSFMHDMLPKIEKLAKHIALNRLDCELEVDGGIDINTAPLVKKAGANVLVAGSAVFKQKDKASIIDSLREA